MNVHAETAVHDPARLDPAIEIADPGAAFWVGQAVLRLRREIAWRRVLGEALSDPAQAALDLLRYDQAKREFFASDPAAVYLGAQIARALPPPSRFSVMADDVGLSAAERFVLGLAMAARLDGALAPVLAACHNDAGKPWPTLELAQALWEDPLAVLAAEDPARPLLCFGLIERVSTGALLPSAGLCRYFSGALDTGPFVPGGAAASEPDAGMEALAGRVSSAPEALEIVPLIGPATADTKGYLAQLSRRSGRAVSAVPAGAQAVNQGILLAWLGGIDCLVGGVCASRDEAAAISTQLSVAPRRPVRVYLHLADRDCLSALPADLLGPVVPLPKCQAGQRIDLLADGLGVKAEAIAGDIRAMARDFALEPLEIARVTAGLGPKVDASTLRAAFRVECSVDFQGLAEPLDPVWRCDDIILPTNIARQFDEARAAIRGAGRVRHDWGERGETGIGLLFAGPPGTGKTMGAQVIAAEEDLPLFRVDLSQIVNKYIGETEKNLRRVFDTAEKMRCILFFDEAEALFGKRTEVKDANDRFANVETGYLLQRMERFSGVAILATNRRKDLDDAFARRLRYVIEFPMPEAGEREAIWRRVFPPGVVLDDVDCGFLARNLQLTGGHIRSIALNASLQAAARGAEPRVTMRDILIASRRELDKLNRKAGRSTFGLYWDEIEELRL
ncbi:MAG: ATP-binding protein [Pseudomonadota bacterium]